MANRKQDEGNCYLFAIRYSLFATHYSLLTCRQHAPANQRFHVPDVLAADFLGDGPDTGRARHRVAAEKQMIAGSDQAGVEQHRIDVAKLAGTDNFREEAAVEIQKRRDKEF